ncbi:MAG: DNA primase [Gammaproteobacteria bacterium WSBS_2016_MAG_OTU1]
MAVSRDFIQQMISAADIAQIIGERVPLKKRGNNMVGLCPFHSEKTPSFSVVPDKGFYHCFGCGASGDVLGFVVKTEGGGDFMSGVEALARRLGMAIPQDGHKSDDSAAKIIAEAAVYFRRQFEKTPVAKEYAKKRGLSEETLKRFGVGYAADDWQGLHNALGKQHEALMLKAGLLRKNDKGDIYDYFRGRLMFPIMESERRTVGFGGRSLTDEQQPKYLNSPDSPIFSKKRTVFGLPQARAAARSKNRLIITEGYMDTVMLSQAGFEETAAAMGTALTPEQMQKIGRTAENIVLAFDGDEAGQKAAARSITNILPTLKDGMSLRFLFLPPGADPDSFVSERGAKAFEQAISNALPLGEYLIKLLWEEASGDSEEGKSSAALVAGEKIIRLLDKTRAPFMRELLLKKLAEHAKISPDVLRKKATKNVVNVTAKGRYRMRVGLLYLFLCCLAARPLLIEKLQEIPPLPGDPTDSKIVAAALHHVMWQPQDNNDILSYLEQEGFVALARQIKETVTVSYSSTMDVPAEFDALVKSLYQKHEKITGAVFQKKLEKNAAIPLHEKERKR